jgi:hypothetical protein
VTARWALLAAVCGTLACRSEVTISLLEDRADGGGAEVPAPPCQKLGAELCNGGDDDCNGLVDEGCSYTVTWSRDPEGPVIGHATGGVMFFEPCPDGDVLVGLRVGIGKWLNQVQALCQQVAISVEPGQTPPRPSVALGARIDTLSFAPAASQDPENQMHDLFCPAGLVLAGVDGTTTTDEPRYILGLRILCAAPIVTTSAAGGPVLAFDPATVAPTDPIVCGTCAATQPFNFTASIAAGHVATSLFGADGLWVDRVGFGSSQGAITKR